ncbi:Gag-Pol polyprotein [Gossypium australe]|uniref:Gag-Pol polyprotein n=1 Tax=Gossypium australe TaxID=47621 RepID=A0A5B6UYK7_9ROSI|nr:Gag-Pol polyprotein [Gossypium australe]
MDPERAVADDVESNAPAPAQGTAPTESRPVSSSHGGKAEKAFFQIMNEWFTQYIRMNPAVQQPPPPPVPQPIPVVPQGIDPLRLNKPPVDKIRKHGAKGFRATVNDDPERAEFWLENKIRVFDELSCTPEECSKCVVSLLRDTAYQWWNTLIFIVPKKYISQRFIDQKSKEFLELKQGRMLVTEYEREVLVGILELKGFVVLFDRDCKAKELCKDKRKADSEARDSRRRFAGKSHQSTSKKFRENHPCSTASAGILIGDRNVRQYSSKPQATSVASVGSIRNAGPECKCNKKHFGECILVRGACFKCGSLDHYLRDCLEKFIAEREQPAKVSNTATRGRPPRNTRNMSGN